MTQLFKKCFILFSISCFLFLQSPKVYAKDNTNNILDTIKSQRVLLMNQDTGEILLEKNSNEKFSPASMTKIMTALIVIENTKNFDKPFTIDTQDFTNLPENTSVTGLEHGEELTIKDALYCMMLTSGSDAANALARFTCGDIDSFVKLMNNKAKYLNLNNTHYTNPYGQNDKNNYTTVKDYALLMDYAMQNPIFKKIVQSTSYQFTSNKKERDLRNLTLDTFHSLSNNSSYTIGTKTGTLPNIISNICSSVTKNNQNLILVLSLSSDKNDYKTPIIETLKIYDWYFDTYKTKTIHEKNEKINIKGNLLTPSFFTKLNQDIYINGLTDQDFKYTENISFTNKKMIVHPNDCVGKLTVQTNHNKSIYPIYSANWHISTVAYIIIASFIICFIFLLYKAKQIKSDNAKKTPIKKKKK